MLTTLNKLNIIGAHFANVNNEVYENNKPQFNDLIIKQHIYQTNRK